MDDINSKKINMVITKDLSRLGRDYIKSGYYLEEYFPQKEIRYVSILDNIDTSIESTNNDIAPFKALFNDMQSKDTSKKIRSILKDKKKQGLFLGASASFGYKKDIKNKYNLVIDEKAAKIVKKIFNLKYNGYSVEKIIEYLNLNNVKTPKDYKNKSSGNKWTKTSVYQILKNRIYIGDMVQGRQAKLNYKSKKRITLHEEDWIIVNNTHEAIISKKIFNEVNKQKKNKFKRPEKKLLEGLVYCKECGSKMSIKKDYRSKKDIYSMNCNRYTKNPKLKECSSHYINYDNLEKPILKILSSINEKFEININRNLIFLLIDKITVSINKEIDIYFNFDLNT